MAEDLTGERSIIDEIRYDEKTDEYSFVFKGNKKFNEFCNRINYLCYCRDLLNGKKK